MKRYLSLLVGVAMVLLISGCGWQSSTDKFDTQPKISYNQNKPEDILDAIILEFETASQSIIDDSEAAIKKIGESYDTYSDNKTAIVDFYSNSLKTAEDLYSSIKTISVDYFKCIAAQGLDDYKLWDNAMEDFYDTWDDGMSDFYEIWDRIYDDIYDKCDDLIEDAFDSLEYAEYSDAWSEMYSAYSDAWSDMYSLYSDAWSDIYKDYSDVWSGFYNDKTDVDAILKAASKNSDQNDEDNQGEENRPLDSARGVKGGVKAEREDSYEKVSGFNEQTNLTIVFHGIRFSFPSYYNVRAEESTEDMVYYYPEEENYYCGLMFKLLDVELSQEEWDNGKSNGISSVREGVEKEMPDMVLIKSEDIMENGLSGVMLFYSENNSEHPAIMNCGFVYNPTNHKIIEIYNQMDSNDESNYDYSGDYEKIMKTASLVEEKSTEEKTLKGVDPDFKATMDSYEEFFDTYVDFMKKYSESDNPIGMLADYTDFMKKYVDIMENMENVDSNDLSAEDHKYYIDVMSRINKKLLEVVDD